jgi:hypothetical protein
MRVTSAPLTLPKAFFREDKDTDVLWIRTPESGGHEVWIEVEDNRWIEEGSHLLGERRDTEADNMALG